MSDRRSVTRTTLAALAAGAITFSLVGESFAQGRGFGMGGMSMGRGFGGNAMRTPGMGQRFPGGDGPRYPGGMYPRRPGVLVIPSVGPYGPYGPGRPPVVEIDDDPPPRRITKQKPHKPKVQQAQQVGPRGGFDLPPIGEQRFVQNEVLLNVSPGTSNSALDSIARRHRLTRLELRDFALTRRRLARLRINDGRAVASVIRSLQADARILGAQPNFLYSLEQAAAGESRPPQYALDKLRLSEAHALARGESVRVAVVDTPIDAKHPDLAGAVAASFDATGASDKPHSHGTGIAGVIAAHGKLTGAAPAVSILAVHAFGSQSSKGSSMNVLKGLDWAGTSKAQIVNMSFAGAADSELHRMLVALRRNGIALIAAAGNAGPSARPLYPAAYPEVIAVTATDVDDNAFDRANRGTHIAVAAPGVAIIAAAPNDSYLMQSGTSFAAAQVSGVAALLIERNRNLDAASIRRILTTTARDLGAPGHDDQFGAGLVDALVAVEQATPKATDVSAQTPRTR